MLWKNVSECVGSQNGGNLSSHQEVVKQFVVARWCVHRRLPGDRRWEGVWERRCEDAEARGLLWNDLNAVEILRGQDMLLL